MPRQIGYHPFTRFLDLIAINMKPTLLIGCIGSSLVVNVGVAQSFDLDWFSIEGGGRVSVGGPYLLSGTVGQPDAGFSSSGPFSLSGGFLHTFRTIQEPRIPELAIAVVDGTVRLSWQLSTDSYVLEQSPTVTGTWSQVMFPHSTNANIISVLMQIADASQFYQLHQK